MGFLPGLATGNGLLVQGPGQGRRAATVMETGNDNHKFFVTPRDPQLVADLHTPGGLGPFAININVAAGHGLAGNRSDLEKPGRPKPLVDPDFLILIGYTQS
jgi:hypothetical protein